jgi:tRNA(Arg) A34 adenosine deaminase TadA
MFGEWMARARAQAAKAASLGEVPVGAVLVAVPTDTLLFEGHNRVETLKDPTAHAEMLAIQEGTRARGAAHLGDCDLYVTLEPCPMCAQALAFARIRRIIFGAFNPKGGGIDHGPRIFESATATFRPHIIGGVEALACQKLLQDFFHTLRQ